MGKTRPQREMGYGISAIDLVEDDQVESKVLGVRVRLPPYF
jgi:hypothetical protein